MIKSHTKIQLQKKIKITQDKLARIGPMRPGSITEQFHKKKDKAWPYWQISYTQKQRSRTEYLRDEFVKQVKKEVAEYKTFKALVDKLVELNIALSKEKLSSLKKSSK